MTIVAQPEKAQTAASMSGSLSGARNLLWLAIVVVVFSGLLGVWHWFDNKWPAPDDASFILGSFRYAELLGHPKFWRPDWWHSMLTVNQAYPPTVMVFNGVLRLLLGGGNWVNALSVVLFGATLTATVFGTTYVLTRDRRAAVLAAITVNLYPHMSMMAHGFALDFPLMAMISLGLFSFVWFRFAPSWGRSVVCGLALGLACLTKQIAAAYLVLPGVFFLIESLLHAMETRRWLPSIQLALSAVVTGLVGLPWMLTNMAFIRNWAHDNASHMGPMSLVEVFPRDIAWYSQSLPSIMSPILFGAFVMALVVLGKAHRSLLPLGLSAVGGVLMVSTLTWAFPSLRYVAPVMIATAIYTAVAMSKLMDRRVPAIAVWAVLGLGFIQYLSFNFAPYPVSQPAFAAQASEVLGVNVVEKWGLTERDQRGFQIRHSTPEPPADWGQMWALKIIDDVEGKQPVYLNILPDYIQLNGNTFELVAHTLGSPVRPTTARRWTIMGDCVKFDPQTALYCKWYLLKSGNQGNLLRDEESERNYAELNKFVSSSGKFELKGTHTLPDGSEMFLYRQK